MTLDKIISAIWSVPSMNISLGVAAMTSPTWLPVHDLSSALTFTTQILGLLLIALQLIKLLKNWRKKQD